MYQQMAYYVLSCAHTKSKTIAIKSPTPTYSTYTLNVCVSSLKPKLPRQLLRTYN